MYCQREYSIRTDQRLFSDIKQEKIRERNPNISLGRNK
jgi:hypothetical protein